LANALVSYVTYLLKTLWPNDLVYLYLHPLAVPIWKVLAAVFFLASISFLAVKAVHRYPYLLVGWMWYMITLIPVIGLVQVGSQAMADRYTYIPLIGIFVIIAWGGQALAERWNIRKEIPIVLGMGVMLILAVSTRIQAGYWKDSLTLFRHAIQVNPNDHVSLTSLGRVHADQGLID
jgi:hypothetical protein